MPPESDAAKPSVLFVCVHNAGRSQMAAVFLTHLAGDRIEVRSAGSLPAAEVNPAAVETVRPIRDQIQAHVADLIGKIHDRDRPTVGFVGENEQRISTISGST
ncbi:hypothetical protein ABT032_49125 [Streptomyces flaveus]